MKILVVDDEALIRTVIKEYCTNNNYEVFEASSGKEALDLLLDNKLYEVKNNFDLPHAYMYITYNKKIKNKNILAVCDFFKEHSFYELNK